MNMEKFDIVEHKYAYITLFIMFTFFMAIWHTMSKIPQNNNIYENTVKETYSEERRYKEYSEDNKSSYNENENRYDERNYSNDEETKYRQKNEYEQYNEQNTTQEEESEEKISNKSPEYDNSRIDTDEYIRATASRRVGD